MNKLISKIVGAVLGVTMATGIGVGVAVGSQNRSFEDARALGEVLGTYTISGASSVSKSTGAPGTASWDGPASTTALSNGKTFSITGLTGYTISDVTVNMKCSSNNNSKATLTWKFDSETGTAVAFSKSAGTLTQSWADKTLFTDLTKTGGTFTITTSSTGSSAYLANVVLYGTYGTPTDGTATYTVATASSVTSGGSAPANSTATFSNTYTSTATQMTSGNYQTYTLTNYGGKKITSVKTRIHRNSGGGGTGNVTVKNGSTNLITERAYVKDDISKGDFTDYEVLEENEVLSITDTNSLVVIVKATQNSLHCDRLSVTWEDATTVTEYTVVYNSNDGGTAPTDPQTYTATTIESVNLQGVGSMSKTGYTCDGWATSAGGSKIYNLSATGVNLKSLANASGVVTLYAHWAINSYSITYYPGTQGTGTSYSGGSVNYNESHQLVTFATTGFGKNSGYAFNGWSVSIGGGAASVQQPGTSITVISNVEATATWVAASKYTLTYNANGGSNAPSAVQYDDGESVTLNAGTSMTAPTNKHFGYWNTLASGLGTSYVGGGTMTIVDNTTLYAIWVDNVDVNTPLIIEPSILSYVDNGALAAFNDTTSNSYLSGVNELIGSDKMLYEAQATGSNKLYAFEPASGNFTNAFDNTKKVILVGKQGAYFYNKAPFDKKIVSFEFYSPTQAGTGYTLKYDFSSSSPLNSSIASSTHELAITTSNLNEQHTLTVANMASSDFHYFRIEIVGAEKNTQFQLKITFADEQQSATPLNSITLGGESAYTEGGNLYMDVPRGKSNVEIPVAYDPSDDPTVDKSLVWSVVDASGKVTVDQNGNVSVANDATVGSYAEVTATPNDTNASAKTIRIKVSAAVVSQLTIGNGISASPVFYTSEGLSSWPSGAIVATYTDGSTSTLDYDDQGLTWYFNNSASGGTDVEIADINSFTFSTSNQRIRASYGGVDSSRQRISVLATPETEIVSGAFTYNGKPSVYVEDVGTMVVRAPAGYTVLSGASDADEYFTSENFVYDSSTQTVSFDYYVLANAAHANVSVSFYWYADSTYQDYKEDVVVIQIVNPSGLAEAISFAGSINSQCGAENKDWSSLENTWTNTLSADAKEFLLNAHFTVSDNTVIKADDTHYIIATAMAHYENMVNTYHFNDFMGRTNAANRINPLFSDSSTISTVLIVVSALAFTTLGGYFLLRKKKEER